ncbi:hypothetical protein PTSG_08763 [Salpingoeca rosetta]|uniref:Uncharacterized protein n=1 Tax=Salpingoeca rosetta (strain ATCC 50818 / BSB-021) TaxID=946362 RepID=F2UKM2_SALR5|nr:uncharacterized protein PTSG_08763 [Salpingoeca rosetta]EGD77671.1 hypothetical protein PTSG_08763 [Salpingoeca rosetta]|eukprot:XP_004990147.1 hypothetical protein PTSG_08763 [Salpingoeca rosetta]
MAELEPKRARLEEEAEDKHAASSSSPTGSDAPAKAEDKKLEPSPDTSTASDAEAETKQKQAEPATTEPAKLEATEAEKRKVLLKKLNTLLLDDRKFPKAAPVLCKLMETDLRRDTSEEFFPLLQKLDALASRRQGNPASMAAYRDIFSLAHRNMDAFSDKHTFQLRTMVLYHVTCHRLNTDDTYQFAQAAKVAHEAIEQLDTAFPKQSDILLGMEITQYVPTDAEKRERLDAIVRVLSTLFQHRKKQWAKTSVDLAFKLAGDRRLIFDQVNRERIDDMYDSIKELRSASTLGTKRSANPRGMFKSWAA